jgi:phosphoserine aminotransferase
MPEEVLTLASEEMLDWQSSGMSVMEMSHRGAEFISIYERTHSLLRELLQIPQQFKILFMQGGGIAQNAVVPLNLSCAGIIDFVLSGSWGQKSYKEAYKFAKPHLVASSEDSGFTRLPDTTEWKLSPQAEYVHLCTNETIHGVECHELPDLKELGSDAPLVIDFSSHALSRRLNWSRVGLAFAGAQKNIGPAGLTVVVVREDLIGRALPTCPSAFNYELVAQFDSMYNTPPTYAIYIAGLNLEWIARQQEGHLSGLDAVEARNIAKAKVLYEFLDKSSFFQNRVRIKDRSRMNIPFFLKDESRNKAFLEGANQHGLLHLKGHKSVGGMRASIYNAMPLQGVQTLVEYLREFERTSA